MTLNGKILCKAAKQTKECTVYYGSKEDDSEAMNKKKKGVKDQNNRIRTDPKGKEEALRQHWQEIFKIQPEDNINFDQKNEPTV